MAREDIWLLQSVLDLLTLNDKSSPLDRPLHLFADTPSAEMEVRAGDRLGKYRLLERIGVGGMGCVYRAERVDGSIRQEVAIKVLHANLRLEARQRFVQEQRILAGLDHPKIARLQDFGSTPSGITYLVMNLVEGTSITEYADQRELPVVERIRLFLQVCDVVRYIARSLKQISAVLRYSGELAGSEALLRRAIAMDRRLGNETTAEAGDRLSDLATLVGRRGERQEALALFDQALEIQRATWGPHSVAVGLTLNGKAGLFQERHGAEEGAQLLHTATEIFRDLLGDDHSLVATGLNNLAGTYVLLSDYEKAEGFQRQAWERDLRRLGAEHPSTLDDRQGLAMILRESGRLPEAEEHLRQTIAVLARVTEPDHPALISQRNDFGRVLLERGFHDQAVEQFELALEAAVARMGRDHWLTGSTYVGLAEWALQRGDSETAYIRASEAVRIFENKEVGRERWRLGEAQSVLGTILVRLGHGTEGKRYLRAAVERLRELRGPSVATRLAEARLHELESS